MSLKHLPFGYQSSFFLSCFISSPPRIILSSIANPKLLFCPKRLHLLPSMTTRTSSSSAATSSMPLQQRPSKPLQHLPPRIIPFDLSSFAESIAKTEQDRNLAYETSRRLQIELIQAKKNILSHPTTTANNDHHMSVMSSFQRLFDTVIPATADRHPRDANLSLRVEDYVRFQSLLYFLDTGCLLPPDHCPFATDEEYLCGGVMGLAQDLARYGLGRATARDVDSVIMAKNLVQGILEMLMEFDFRNGALRRKYDGTKYALKTLETLLYELSITGATATTTATTTTGSSSGDGSASVAAAIVAPENAPAPMDVVAEPKKIKLDPSLLTCSPTVLLPMEQLELLRKRIEHRDELRELLIKRCRDSQKAAKQAIYALHRADKNKAAMLISQCETSVEQELAPIVNEDPFLRSGSYAGVLEELVEAKLFYTWLYGRGDDSHENEASSFHHPAGVLMHPDDFNLSLQAIEYLGGLCDLTGEIGRYAVAKGTARETDNVRLCLHTNDTILSWLESMGKLPPSIVKKVDSLKYSVEKIERMLYELSLSQATGRTVNSTAVEREHGDVPEGGEGKGATGAE